MNKHQRALATSVNSEIFDNQVRTVYKLSKENERRFPKLRKISCQRKVTSSE